MKNNIKIDLQIAIKNVFCPPKKDFVLWANKVGKIENMHGEICIRVIDVAEIQMLNKKYRHKDKPTNVLSFNYDYSTEDKNPLLGDIAICAEIVNQEAKEKNISSEAHWAHIVIHGALHLFGYDHDNDSNAVIMEQKEILILEELSFSNPYNL